MNKTSVGRVVGLGLLGAVVVGTAMGLIFDVRAGVVGGAAYGIVMAIAMRRVWGSTALKGLSRKQRRQVVRTLRRGEPMHDRDLMTPLVNQGKVILRQPFNPKAARIMFALVFLVGAVVAGMSVAEDGSRGLIYGGPLMLISLAMIFGVVPWTVRMREHMARSIAATEQILVSQMDREY